MAGAPPSGLPELKLLIRPESIRQIAKFPEEQRQKYIDGVTELWHKIDNNSPESDEYRSAHKRLADVTKNVKITLQKINAMSATQPNGIRPTSSGQPAQQEARPPGSNLHSGGQPQPAEPYSQKIVEEVKRLNIVPPTTMKGSEEQKRIWVRDAQRKFADMLQKHEAANRRLFSLHQAANARTQQGRPLNQKENDSYQSQISGLENTLKETQITLQGFRSSQEAYKNQQSQNQTSVGDSARSNTSQNSLTQNPNPLTAAGGLPHIKQEAHGQPHTLSSAVDAARNQGNSVDRPALSPHNSGSSTQPPTNQPLNSRPQLGQAQVSHSHPPLNINTTSAPQHNSPRVAPSHSSTIPHEPVPLSHSDAVVAARSYSQPNMPQQTPQSATQGPSSDQRNQNNHAKMPIPKDLNLQPTQPVSMGPSRPTLTNGPIALGPMGQPAIQKHPGFVLEGEGERVLSKKKLEELVRQVTGGTGVEGEEGEGLTAEVEETLLEVADEFVDQVIVAACQLAKIRQSSSLELRDLQLILERNYNIRVPGFASDELRTVRKVIPAQAWTQKLSAVQAAKVTGGKGDL
ncbi:Transcription initiation factor TFIID subunit 12 [Lecanora helva]